MGASRTSKAGRRPGNQDTRGKILDAARDAFATKGFAGTSMRAIAADASVDAALIHHYFDSKQQLFLATVQIPVPIGDIAQHVGEDGIDGLGERLIRTILGIWDSDLQPSLIAAIRTSLTDPSMIRSISEFLTLEVIGRILHTLDLPEAEAERRAGLMASQVLGVVVGRYVLQLPPLVGAEFGVAGRRHRTDPAALSSRRAARGGAMTQPQMG